MRTLLMTVIYLFSLLLIYCSTSMSGLDEDEKSYKLAYISPDLQTYVYSLYLTDFYNKNTIILTDSINTLTLAWSSDSKYIYFGKGSLLKRITIEDKTIQTVCDVGLIGRIYFSPDEEKFLTYQNIGEAQFITLVFDINGNRILSMDDPIDALWQDDQNLLINSNISGNFEIYSLNIYSKEMKQITDDPANDSFCTDFSTENKTILCYVRPATSNFSDNHNDTNWKIKQINLDTKISTTIYSDSMPVLSSRWIPKKAEISFLKSNLVGSYQLFKINVADSNVKQLTFLAGSVDDYIWLNDGIGFIYCDSDIFMLKTDNTLTQIADFNQIFKPWSNLLVSPGKI